MATFSDWLNKERVMPVQHNRLFCRALYFHVNAAKHVANVSRADTLLRVLADDLALFPNVEDAKWAMQETVEWAEAQEWDVSDEGNIARMAKHFFDFSALDRRPLNDDLQPREVKR